MEVCCCCCFAADGYRIAVVASLTSHRCFSMDAIEWKGKKYAEAGEKNTAERHRCLAAVPANLAKNITITNDTGAL